MEKLYILMHRKIQFTGQGDPDHWDECIIAQSTDKSFIDKIVKDNNLALGDINDIWDFGHTYFVKEMDIPFINEYAFNLYHLKKVSIDSLKNELNRFEEKSK